MKQLLIILTILLFAIQGNAQAYTKVGTWFEWPRGKFTNLLGLPKDTIQGADEGALAYKAGIVYVRTAIKWISVGTGASGVAYNTYSQLFNGTTSNQFTVSKTVSGLDDIALYVNGQKVPKEYLSLNVNTIQINAGLSSFSTDTGDKVEVVYKSTQ